MSQGKGIAVPLCGPDPLKLIGAFPLTRRGLSQALYGLVNRHLECYHHRLATPGIRCLGIIWILPGPSSEL